MYIDERPSVTVPYDVCALTAHSSTESATPTGGWADYMYIPQHTTLIFTITKCLLDYCMAKKSLCDYTHSEFEKVNIFCACQLQDVLTFLSVTMDHVYERGEQVDLLLVVLRQF